MVPGRRLANAHPRASTLLGKQIAVSAIVSNLSRAYAYVVKTVGRTFLERIMILT